MRPHQLRALIAVAEYGSFRAAARGIDLSQAALTKAIKELEDEMGIEVVTHTSDSVRLTQAGEVLCMHAQAISAEMRAALDDIERVKSGTHPAVTAAISPVSSIALLAAAYRAFRSRLPDVRVDLLEAHPAHSLPRLRDGSVDFVVVGISGNRAREEFSAVDLFADELVLGCRLNHPLAESTSIAQLQGAEWILHATSTEFVVALKAQLARQGVAEPRWSTGCANFTHIMTLVTECDAIVAMPSHVWRAPWVAGSLVRIPLVERLPGVKVSVYTRRLSPLSPAARELIECFRDAASAYNAGQL
jgi:LysR family transcriptional regulator, regulator of abg operon